MARKAKLQAVPEQPEEKPIEITGAQLKDIFCNYSYDHTVAANTVNSVNIKSQVPTHEDLRTAFKALNPHLAVICEEVDPDMIPDIAHIEEFDPGKHTQEMIHYKLSLFTVYAFSIVGEGESQAVILKGHKRLSTGDNVKLETPAVKWDDAYSFLHDLRIATDDLIAEVELYMQGKQAAAFVQQEMFDEAYAEESR